MGYENHPTTCSSAEYWAMYESMTQQFDGNEEGYSSRKVRPNTRIMLKCIERSCGKYWCQQPR